MAVMGEGGDVGFVPASMSSLSWETTAKVLVSLAAIAIAQIVIARIVSKVGGVLFGSSLRISSIGYLSGHNLSLSSKQADWRVEIGSLVLRHHLIRWCIPERFRKITGLQRKKLLSVSVNALAVHLQTTSRVEHQTDQDDNRTEKEHQTDQDDNRTEKEKEKKRAQKRGAFVSFALSCLSKALSSRLVQSWILRIVQLFLLEINGITIKCQADDSDFWWKLTSDEVTVLTLHFKPREDAVFLTLDIGAITVAVGPESETKEQSEVEAKASERPANIAISTIRCSSKAFLPVSSPALMQDTVITCDSLRWALGTTQLVALATKSSSLQPSRERAASASNPECPTARRSSSADYVGVDLVSAFCQNLACIPAFRISVDECSFSLINDFPSKSHVLDELGWRGETLSFATLSNSIEFVRDNKTYGELKLVSRSQRLSDGPSRTPLRCRDVIFSVALRDASDPHESQPSLSGNGTLAGDEASPRKKRVRPAPLKAPLRPYKAEVSLKMATALVTMSPVMLRWKGVADAIAQKKNNFQKNSWKPQSQLQSQSQERNRCSSASSRTDPPEAMVLLSDVLSSTVVVCTATMASSSLLVYDKGGALILQTKLESSSLEMTSSTAPMLKGFAPGFDGWKSPGGSSHNLPNSSLSVMLSDIWVITLDVGNCRNVVVQVEDLLALSKERKRTSTSNKMRSDSSRVSMSMAGDEIPSVGFDDEDEELERHMRPFALRTGLSWTAVRVRMCADMKATVCDVSVTAVKPTVRIRLRDLGSFMTMVEDIVHSFRDTYRSRRGSFVLGTLHKVPSFTSIGSAGNSSASPFASPVMQPTPSTNPSTTPFLFTCQGVTVIVEDNISLPTSTKTTSMHMIPITAVWVCTIHQIDVDAARQEVSLQSIAIHETCESPKPESSSSSNTPRSTRHSVRSTPKSSSIRLSVTTVTVSATTMSAGRLAESTNRSDTIGPIVGSCAVSVHVSNVSFEWSPVGTLRVVAVLQNLKQTALHVQKRVVALGLTGSGETHQSSSSTADGFSTPMASSTPTSPFMPSTPPASLHKRGKVAVNLTITVTDVIATLHMGDCKKTSHPVAVISIGTLQRVGEVEGGNVEAHAAPGGVAVDVGEVAGAVGGGGELGSWRMSDIKIEMGPNTKSNENHPILTVSSLAVQVGKESISINSSRRRASSADATVPRQLPPHVRKMKKLHIVVESNSVKFVLPHKLHFGDTFQDSICCVKGVVKALSALKEHHEYAAPLFTPPANVERPFDSANTPLGADTRRRQHTPFAAGAVEDSEDVELPFTVSLKICGAVFDLEDEYLESVLSAVHPLWKDESLQQHHRQKLLERQIEALQRAGRLSSQRADELRDQLVKENSEIYYRRVRPLREQLHSLSRPLARFEASSLDLEVSRTWDLCLSEVVMEKVNYLDSHKGAKGRSTLVREEFDDLFALDIGLNLTNFSMKIRDFPLPVVIASEIEFTGQTFLAELMPTAETTYNKVVSLGDTMTAVVPRSSTPMKLFYDLSSSSTRLSVSYGPAYQPPFSDLGEAMARLSPESMDPSPPIEWWDKLRYLTHGRLYHRSDLFELKMIASPLLHERNKYMQFQFQSVDLTIEKGKSSLIGKDAIVFANTGGKSPPSKLLQTPVCKIVVEYDFVCDSGQPYNHMLSPIPLRNHSNSHDQSRMSTSEPLRNHSNSHDQSRMSTSEHAATSAPTTVDGDAKPDARRTASRSPISPMANTPSLNNHRPQPSPARRFNSRSMSAQVPASDGGERRRRHTAGGGAHQVGSSPLTSAGGDVSSKSEPSQSRVSRSRSDTYEGFRSRQVKFRWSLDFTPPNKKVCSIFHFTAKTFAWFSVSFLHLYVLPPVQLRLRQTKVGIAAYRKVTLSDMMKDIELTVVIPRVMLVFKNRTSQTERFVLTCENIRYNSNMHLVQRMVRRHPIPKRVDEYLSHSEFRSNKIEVCILTSEGKRRYEERQQLTGSGDKDKRVPYEDVGDEFLRASSIEFDQIPPSTPSNPANTSARGGEGQTRGARRTSTTHSEGKEGPSGQTKFEYFVQVGSFRLLWTLESRNHFMGFLEGYIGAFPKQTLQATPAQEQNRRSSSAKGPQFGLLQYFEINKAGDDEDDGVGNPSSNENAGPLFEAKPIYLIEFVDPQVNIQVDENFGRLLIAAEGAMMSWHQEHNVHHPELILRNIIDIGLVNVQVFVAAMEVDVSAGVMWATGDNVASDVGGYNDTVTPKVNRPRLSKSAKSLSESYLNTQPTVENQSESFSSSFGINGVLKRIIPPCTAKIAMNHHPPVADDVDIEELYPVDTELERDTKVVIQVPQLQATTDSFQFAVTLGAINKVLLARREASEEKGDKLLKSMYKTAVQVDEMMGVDAVKEELKQIGYNIKHLESLLSSLVTPGQEHGRHHHHHHHHNHQQQQQQQQQQQKQSHGGADDGNGESEKRVPRESAHVTSIREELEEHKTRKANLLMTLKAIKVTQKAKTGTKDTHLRVNYTVTHANWILTSNRKEFAELSLNGVLGNITSFSDESGEMDFQVGDVEIKNRMPKAYFSNYLQRFVLREGESLESYLNQSGPDQPHPHGGGGSSHRRSISPTKAFQSPSKVLAKAEGAHNVLLRMYILYSPPVNGIEQYDIFEVNLFYPLKINLTFEVFGLLQSFFIPETATESKERPLARRDSVTASDGDGGLSLHLLKKNKHPLSLGGKSKEHDGMGDNPKAIKKTTKKLEKKKSDFFKMKDRAKNNIAFNYIYIDEVDLLVSWKRRPGESNIEDCENLPIRLKPISYNSKFLSWEDLYFVVKKDAIVDISLQTASSFARYKLKLKSANRHLTFGQRGLPAILKQPSKQLKHLIRVGKKKITNLPGAHKLGETIRGRSGGTSATSPSAGEELAVSTDGATPQQLAAEEAQRNLDAVKARLLLGTGGDATTTKSRMIFGKHLAKEREEHAFDSAVENDNDEELQEGGEGNFGRVDVESEDGSSTVYHEAAVSVAATTGSGATVEESVESKPPLLEGYSDVKEWVTSGHRAESFLMTNEMIFNTPSRHSNASSIRSGHRPNPSHTPSRTHPSPSPLRFSQTVKTYHHAPETPNEGSSDRVDQLRQSSGGFRPHSNSAIGFTGDGEVVNSPSGSVMMSPEMFEQLRRAGGGR